MVRTRREGSPVPVAPELLIEIGAMAVVVSKWCFALNPVYNVSLHSFSETEHTETLSDNKLHKQDEEGAGGRQYASTGSYFRKKYWHMSCKYLPMGTSRMISGVLS